MFHDLFALIKVTQNHNEVCMDTSYCCHLTTTHTFSTHLHQLCRVQRGFNNDTTEGKFAIFVRQPHICVHGVHCTDVVFRVVVAFPFRASTGRSEHLAGVMRGVAGNT